MSSLCVFILFYIYFHICHSEHSALNALVLQYQCIFTLGFSFYLFICLYIIIIVITIIGIILVF